MRSCGQDRKRHWLVDQSRSDPDNGQFLGVCLLTALLAASIPGPGEWHLDLLVAPKVEPHCACLRRPGVSVKEPELDRSGQRVGQCRDRRRMQQPWEGPLRHHTGCSSVGRVEDDRATIDVEFEGYSLIPRASDPKGRPYAGHTQGQFGPTV